MLNSIRKDAVKNKRTKNTLRLALRSLLQHGSFEKITVSDLCNKAQISRATFYVHFDDKYDLFRFSLVEIRENVLKDIYKFDELEKEVNQFICANQRVITNVLKEANGETLMLIHEFILYIFDQKIKRKVRDKSSPQYIVLSNFIVGGLLNLLTWMVENGFPPDVKMIDYYLYKMIGAMIIWDAEQD